MIVPVVYTFVHPCDIPSSIPSFFFPERYLLDLG
jgi:hypothetical protein